MFLHFHFFISKITVRFWGGLNETRKPGAGHDACTCFLSAVIPSVTITTPVLRQGSWSSQWPRATWTGNGTAGFGFSGLGFFSLNQLHPYGVSLIPETKSLRQPPCPAWLLLLHHSVLPGHSVKSLDHRQP